MKAQELALQSINEFNKLPENRELYKFTHLARFFEEMPTQQAQAEVDLARYTDAALPTFLFVNGELKQSPELPGLKVSNSPMEELNNGTALSELHHELSQQGLVLEVAKNTKLSAPVRILNLITQSDITAPTVVVRLERFAEMTLVEETRGLTDSYAQVSEAYVQLAEGAKLEHIQLEGGTNGSLHHGNTWAKVAKDASYRNFVFALSGKVTRRNLDLALSDAGANGESYELFLAANNEHIDLNSVINHLAADTTSNQLAKSVLADDAKGVFTGKIFIHPKAQRVASGQLNKNLLLSKKAHIHSQPQLEIFADDVKCSHGSTTGQMSEEEVFYFETRGIPSERARTLLAFGFGLEVVLKIQDQQIRERIEIAVMSALREKFNIGDAK